MEHQFDELAKALAKGVSRREALRRVAGALAGALLAGWGAGKAAAQAPASGCERYCRSLFDPRQSQGAYGECVSRCAVCLVQMANGTFRLLHAARSRKGSRSVQRKETFVKPATRSLVFAVLAVLCLTVAVRNPVSAASQIPIRGTLTVVEGTYPNSFTAVGILTGLGPVTMTSALGFPFAHLTLTTRSGEQLQASALFLSFPSFGIDGGTGRFEGADGFLDLSTVDGTKVGVQGTLILNP